MNTEVRKRAVIEMAVVAAAGVALSVLLYSDAFRACCGQGARSLVGALLLPAFFVASFIGGGVHNASPVHFTIGVVVEFLAVWALVWGARRAVQRFRHA
jgi:hypothetical protein